MPRKKKDETVALNLRVPRWRRDAIAAAADAKGQKIVRYIMDAVDAQMELDDAEDQPPGMSEEDLAKLSAHVLEKMRENGDI